MQINKIKFHKFIINIKKNLQYLVNHNHKHNNNLNKIIFTNNNHPKMVFNNNYNNNNNNSNYINFINNNKIINNNHNNNLIKWHLQIKKKITAFLFKIFNKYQNKIKKIFKR